MCGAQDWETNCLLKLHHDIYQLLVWETDISLTNQLADIGYESRH